MNLVTDTLDDPPPGGGSPDDRVGEEFYGWDWTATTHQGRDRIVNDLVEALGTEIALPGKGIHGWAESLRAFDAEGYALGAVYFGGGRDDVHVISTSSAADKTRTTITGMDSARTSRVDTCVDTLVPFDQLAAECESAAMGYGARITRMESSERGVSLGRTVYLGAPTSAIRVRLYEKWLQAPGEYPDGTNRVEVQLRPASRVKERVSSWNRAETFCASRVTQDLARRLGAELVPKGTLHIARGTPDLERTLEVMGDQYGAAVGRWLAISGGDIGRVVDYLTGEIGKLEAAPVQPRKRTHSK